MVAAPAKFDPRKPAGFVLLVMGWLLVLTAIILLKEETVRGGFALAGIAVEAVGLVLITLSHIAPGRERV